MVHKENADIIVFQEVKKEIVDCSLIGSVWSSRFKEWLLLPSIGSSGGTLLIWDVRSVKVESNLIRDFSISIFVRDSNGSSWWLFMV